MSMYLTYTETSDLQTRGGSYGFRAALSQSIGWG